MGKPSYKAPFLKDGTVPLYPHNMSWGGDGNVHQAPDRDGIIEWKEVEPFHAVITLDRMDKGSHGATRYVFKNCHTGAEYMMYTKDLLDLLQTSTMTNGLIQGDWVVQKRGANYGIRKA